jgi:hypothetical protein
MITLRIEWLIILIVQVMFSKLHSQERLKVYKADEKGLHEYIVEGKYAIRFGSKDSVAEFLLSNMILSPDSIRKRLPEISKQPNFRIREDTVQFRESRFRRWKGYNYFIYDCSVVFQDNYLSVIDFKVRVDDRTFAVLRSLLIARSTPFLKDFSSSEIRMWELSRLIYLYGQMDL